jgi:endonuclease-3
MSKDLISKYDGVVPSTLDELVQLAGVGRKTANVVLNVWYNIPALAVDTHVMRISQRLGFTKATTPLAIEHDLMKVLPKEYIIKANHWLVLFGRYVCKALRPECNNCPISQYCKSKDKKL